MASSRRGSGGRSVAAPRRRRPRRQFFIQLALDRAANLVLECVYDVDQDHYEILIPAAEVARRQAPPRRDDTAAGDDQLFPEEQPIQAIQARRSAPAQLLRPIIGDQGFRTFEPHDAYEARLRLEHGRKGSFW